MPPDAQAHAFRARGKTNRLTAVNRSSDSCKCNIASQHREVVTGQDRAALSLEEATP